LADDRAAHGDAGAYTAGKTDTAAGRTASQNAWDSTLYDESFGVITRFGAGVVDLLAARPGERILDLGCGTGHLTAQIAQLGADTIGLDSSEPMIDRARAAYPDLRFEVARGEDFMLDAPVDAVFSSAVLHWIPDQGAVHASVARALKPGGRFVAEMGGKGNVRTLLTALDRALTEEGVPSEQIPHPWSFFSIPEYSAMLERAGFEVTFMHLFDRPTPLDDCPNGAADWVRMFGDDFLAPVRPERHAYVLARVNELAAPALLHDGRWIADYRRLRFVAVKR
jgi:trans-aconitate methyltransferase